jgi:hypothetical protein
MRILLDENLDWRLRHDLPGHETVAFLPSMSLTPVAPFAGANKRLFFWSRFFGALGEFFRGWAESAFSREEAEGNWLWLGRESNEFHSPCETVAKRVYGDAYSHASLDR